MLRVLATLGVLASVTGVVLRVVTPAFFASQTAAPVLVVLGAALAAAAAIVLAVRCGRVVWVLSGSSSVLALVVAVGFRAWLAASGASYADIGGGGVVVGTYLVALVMSLVTAWGVPRPPVKARAAALRP